MQLCVHSLTAAVLSGLPEVGRGALEFDFRVVKCCVVAFFKKKQNLTWRG